VSILEQHLSASQKIQTDDLDWALAAKVGLTEDERNTLRFFADVEGQTVHYFLEVAQLQAARDPEILTFLTMWNYEEYFHGHALTKMLEVCGDSKIAACERAAAVRSNARFKAKIEDLIQRMMAKIVPQAFVSLWMTWGALQEAVTCKGYEALERTTKNPVLSELARRIAKQERRHFAYYYAQAREHLSRSTFSQRFTRFIVKKFFSLVGSGVKTPAQMAYMLDRLFPGPLLRDMTSYVDHKVSALPGLSGLTVVHEYSVGCTRLLPEVSGEVKASAIEQSSAGDAPAASVARLGA
jgi:rubrerythrin